MNDAKPAKRSKKGLREVLISASLGLAVFLFIIFLSTKKSAIPVDYLSNATEVPRNLIFSSLPIEPLWQIKIDEPVSTSPVISADTVVVPTVLALYALDIRTGKQRWRHESGPHPSPPPIVVSRKTLLYGEGNNVFALNVISGEIIWQHELNSNDVKDIVIGQNIVYVVAQPTWIDTLDLGTGELIWSVNGYDSGIPTRGPSLFFQNNELYVFTTQVHILDADTGTIKRVIQRNLKPEQLVNDKFYNEYWVRDAKSLRLIADLKSPSSRSGQSDCENFNTPYAFSSYNLYYGAGRCGGVYALDNITNHIRWAYRENVKGESPVAVYRDVVYILFDDGEIHAVDPQTGENKGVLKTDREILGWVRNANFLSRGVVANKDVLIATFNDKNVWAFCEAPCFEKE